MATTFKLYSSAATDGAVYIDLPVSGKIVTVSFVMSFQAGAGGAGTFMAELSRQAVNQVTTSNPRGVIAQAAATTAAASQGAQVNSQQYPNEPVKSGERLYLNCAGGVTNFGAGNATCLITIA